VIRVVLHAEGHEGYAGRETAETQRNDEWIRTNEEKHAPRERCEPDRNRSLRVQADRRTLPEVPDGQMVLDFGTRFAKERASGLERNSVGRFSLSRLWAYFRSTCHATSS
jgi:hypothetical protein